MSDIDPMEFGQIRAQVSQLLESDRQKTLLLQAMSEDMQAIRLQLAEAKGGWRLLVALGGAASALGGVITWGLSHIRWTP
jgi:hypothetical protein